MASVIVLGAAGRFGRAATIAFREAGWSVTELARSWPAAGQRKVSVDVEDTSALTEACIDQDVIVNAINPPYHHWARAVPRVTASVIEAAKANNATVLIPGNIYNYGTTPPESITEATPWRGDTRKGEIRIRMERAFRDSGVRTIVLRGGDFIEAERTGNWFDTHIAAKAWSGKLAYPGPRDRTHAWAYLPDMARAAVELAQARYDFATFEEFGFPGYSLTGAELAEHVSSAVGRRVQVSGFPWFAVKVMVLWSPLMREVLEMRYLWDIPHAMDGAKLCAALPQFRATPAAQAIAEALAQHTPANCASVVSA
jgi:nucleoside-diphosphate-sugar epimerase